MKPPHPLQVTMKGNNMPKVGKKKFPYTKLGKKLASMYKKKMGKKK